MVGARVLQHGQVFGPHIVVAVLGEAGVDPVPGRPARARASSARSRGARTTLLLTCAVKPLYGVCCKVSLPSTGA